MSGVVSMLFGGDQPKAIAPPTDEEAKLAAKAEAERLRKRRGFLSTIFTSTQGVTGEANVKKAELGA